MWPSQAGCWLLWAAKHWFAEKVMFYLSKRPSKDWIVFGRMVFLSS